MTRTLSLQLVSGLLFLVLCGMGFRIAASKPLWMDELFTQNHAVQDVSAFRLLVGRNTGEGNNAPLFYLMQKWTRFVPDAQVSRALADDAICGDLKKQLLLRIVPVLFMSGALALLFYFFSLELSLLAGMYALLCSLASPMVWLYWAEARPYPLIVFFTVVQSLILLKMVQGREARDRYWGGLAAVNFLLAFTSYLSLIQVVGSAIVLWCVKERLWTRLVWVLAPVLVAMFYRSQGIHEAYDLLFEWRYFLDNIPLERIAFYGLAGSLLCVARARTTCFFTQESVRSYTRFFLWALTGFALILLAVKLQERHVKELGLHSRFFIALTPMGIIEQVLLAWCLFRAALAERWLAVTAVTCVILLSIIAFCHTSVQVLSGLKFL